ESFQPITEKNERIWAFGYEGEIYFNEGKVNSYTEEALTEDDYVTLLIRFPDDTFATNDKINKDFETIKEQAFEGSDYGQDKVEITVIEAIMIPIFLLAFFMCFVLFIIQIFVAIKKRKWSNKYKGEYRSDPPHKDGYLGIYTFLIALQKSSFDYLFTAILLKWVQEEKIDIRSKAADSVFKTKTTTIHLL